MSTAHNADFVWICCPVCSGSGEVLQKASDGDEIVPHDPECLIRGPHDCDCTAHFDGQGAGETEE